MKTARIVSAESAEDRETSRGKSLRPETHLLGECAQYNLSHSVEGWGRRKFVKVWVSRARVVGEWETYIFGIDNKGSQGWSELDGSTRENISPDALLERLGFTIAPAKPKLVVNGRTGHIQKGFFAKG